MLKSLQGKLLLFFMFALILNLFRINMAFSDEASSRLIKEKEKMTEINQDSKRSVKKEIRKVNEENCKEVNGKTKCMKLKTKHTVESGADKMEDAID